MTPALLVLAALGSFLAYANGANDVSKGVATLVSSRVASYPRALAWGTFWTAAGGLAGVFLSGAMMSTFGSGLLTAGVRPSLDAGIATLAGAAAWVALATWRRLPVSTTHAIVGALAGVAVVAYGANGLRWSALMMRVAVPLMVTPVLAAGATVLVLRTSRVLNRGSQEDPECVCAQVQVASLQPAGLAHRFVPASLPLMGALRVWTGSRRACAVHGSATLQIGLSGLHWATAGAASAARALNDVPKIVASMVAAAALGGNQEFAPTAFAVVTIAMVAGSWSSGRRVTSFLAEDIISMRPFQGVLASGLTAVLVGSGAVFGLPMSTTHVSGGAILGVANENGQGADWSAARRMLFAWLVTAPVAAFFGIAILFSLGVLHG